MKVRLMTTFSGLWHEYLMGEVFCVKPKPDNPDMYLVIDNSFNRDKLDYRHWDQLTDQRLVIAKKRTQVMEGFSSNQQAAVLLSKEW